MTELEILRRRRELVVLSAELQRATVVRRLDRIDRHPAQTLLAMASSVISIPLAWKLGSGIYGLLARKRQARVPARGRSMLQKVMSAMKYVAVLKAFPVPKFFHR
jgi:hypothetical protein